MRIRSRSDTPWLGGATMNVLLNSTDRSAGGRLMRGFQRLWKGPTGNGPPTTDGQHSPTQVEPLVSEAAIVVHSVEQYLQDQHFYEADELLIDREKHLFGDTTLTDPEEEIARLSADRAALQDLVLQTVQQSLSLTSNNGGTSTLTAALTSAVKAVQQEEEQDQMWRHRGRSPPSWRPCGWRGLHDAALQELVVGRMENHLTAPSGPQAEQSSIQVDVMSLALQLKGDLQHVVGVLKSCYPAEMDICNFYAGHYHRIFSDRLSHIAEFGLDDSDCTFLLLWVNNHYPGMLREFEADIDASALGKLLPAELLQPLEDQYLNKQKTELSTYMGRVLEEAKEKFSNGEEPEMEDGCYSSPVAYDIIQLINGMVTSAVTTVGDLHKAQNITRQLNDLMLRFKLFQEDVIKQNRANSRAQIKANLSCIAQFSDVLVRKKHLFSQEVQENCLPVLTNMKQAAHAYLLTPVHKVLKPQYQKLGTNEWLQKNHSEKLLVAIEQVHQELQGSSPSCHQELMGRLHREVTEEYVKRLLRGDKLKNRERQDQAYATVTDDAKSLHKLFSRMGSQEAWLKEILIKIAEVLKLQDVPAMQMQVAWLGSVYPDFSERHVSALLKLKTNLCKADRRTIKATLADTLKEAAVGPDTRTFFSNVEVR